MLLLNKIAQTTLLTLTMLIPLHLTAQGTDNSMPFNLPYLVNDSHPNNSHIISLQKQGKITEAKAALRKQLVICSNLNRMKDFGDEIERLDRLTQDFNLTATQLLEKINDDIPDVTMDDLLKWKEAGDLQWALIDDKECFFRKEPRNLYRHNEEAKKRKEAFTKTVISKEDTSALRGFNLHDHLTDVLKEIDETGSDRAITVTMTATQTVTLDPGVVPVGETVRCWIPFPQEYQRQRDIELLETSCPNPIVAPNGSAHRTVYQEQKVADNPTTMTFFVKYRYTTESYVPQIDPEKVTPYNQDSELYKEYTAEALPHIRFTPEVKALVKDIIGDETNPLLKADKLFRWMDGNIGYCSEMEYSIMPSIIDKIMYERAGDCGIQAIMFINLCRAAGVPARWQSGWAMRPNAANLHDWAEFYVEPYGWLPADPSFGLRDHDDARIKNFYIGHIDSYRLIANLGFAQPFSPKKNDLRSDPIDNQRGELEWLRGNIYYDQFSYKMEIEYDYK